YVRAIDSRDDDAEAVRVLDLVALEFPRVARYQAFLGKLDLPAILQRLPEYPVVVANSIPVSGYREGGHAFHEAGGEASEAAVAQRGVRLELAQLVEVDAERAQRGACDFG